MAEWLNFRRDYEDGWFGRITGAGMPRARLTNKHTGVVLMTIRPVATPEQAMSDCDDLHAFATPNPKEDRT